jgi:hypothetical protein
VQMPLASRITPGGEFVFAVGWCCEPLRGDDRALGRRCDALRAALDPQLDRGATTDSIQTSYAAYVDATISHARGWSRNSLLRC